MESRRSRWIALLLCSATLLAVVPPIAPAATVPPIPFHDSFDADTIATGDWDVVAGAPLEATISDGDLRLRVTDPTKGGGGGINRPVPALAPEVVLETRFTPVVVYRYGAALRAPGANPTVILEATDFLGFSLSYHDTSGRWRNAPLGVSVAAGATYHTRLVLDAGNRASAAVYDSEGILLGRASATNVQLVPSAVTFIDVNVWRDGSSNPMSEAVVHDVWLNDGGLRPPEDVAAEQGNVVGSVRLTWTPTIAANSYGIYRLSEGDANWVLTGSTAGANFTDTRLPTGWHQFYVTSFADGLESAPSTFVNVEVVSPYTGTPRNVTARQGTTFAEAVVTWEVPRLGVPDSYVVHRFGEDGISAHPVSAPPFSARFLPAGTHTFYVIALNGSFDSKPSATADATVGAPVIVALGDSVGAGHGLGPSTGWPENAGNGKAHADQIARALKGSATNLAFSGACAVSLQSGAPRTASNCDTSIYDHQLDDLFRLFPAGPPALLPSLITISAGGNDINFAQCLDTYLRKAERGECEPTSLAEHLAAYEDNMGLVLATIRGAYNDQVPIVLTQYFNPFPIASRGHAPCGIWMAAAAHEDVGTVFAPDDSPAWRASLEAIQVRAEVDVDGLLANLNAAIANVAALTGVTVVPVDFTDHDACRSERDPAATASDVWAFAPELSLRGRANACLPFTPVCRPFLDVQHDFAAAPHDVVPETPDPDPFRFDVEGRYGNISAYVRVNGFPHPTEAGQAEIARGILRIVAPERLLE